MEPHGRSAFVLYVQTFGDLVTFNPHIHALVADGVFLGIDKLTSLAIGMWEYPVQFDPKNVF